MKIDTVPFLSIPYSLFPVLKRCFTWGNPKTALFAIPYSLFPNPYPLFKDLTQFDRVNLQRRSSFTTALEVKL